MESADTTLELDLYGTVVLSKPEGARIWIDQQFVGNIPATLKLTVGRHEIVIRSQGYADWIKKVQVLRDSQVTLSPWAEYPP